MKLLTTDEIQMVVTSSEKLLHPRSRAIMHERDLGPLQVYPAYERYRTIQKQILSMDFFAIADQVYLEQLIAAFGCAAIVYSELSVRECVSFLLPAQIQTPLVIADDITMLTGLVVSTTHRNGIPPEYFAKSADNCFEVYETLCAVE